VPRRPPGVGDPGTLFCCLPFDIASIVSASQMDGKHAAGDIAGTREASGEAEFWAMLSATAVDPGHASSHYVPVPRRLGALGELGRVN
jgi:hypothetical protein